MANSYTSAYLAKRKELQAARSVGQTATQKMGQSSGSTADNYTSAYLAKRKELQTTQSAGQQTAANPAAALRTLWPSLGGSSSAAPKAGQSAGTVTPAAAAPAATPAGSALAGPLASRLAAQAQSREAAEKEIAASLTPKFRQTSRAEVRARAAAEAKPEAAAQPETAAEIKARVDELTAQIETLEDEQRQQRPQRSGSLPGPRVTPAQAMSQAAQLTGQINELKQQRDQLASQYYHAQNQEQLTGIQTDAPMLERYTAAQELQADMDKVAAVAGDALTHSGGEEITQYKEYLAEKYGLTQEAIDNYAVGGAQYQPPGDGYTNIMQLYYALEAQKGQAADALETGGYHYEGMAGYEQMLQDAQDYAKKQEEFQAYAKEHPILSSLDSVLISPFQGVDFLKTMAGGIGHSDSSDLKNYVPMNVYNMDTTNAVSAIRGTISRDLEENTNWEIFGQNMASFLYQTGMSVGDSMLQVGAMGPGAAYIMGASAASNQAKDIIERGGSNSQAFWGGLAAGAAETIFERVSIERLLSIKTPDGWKDVLAETLKQAGVEASEEAFTEIANILSDAAIMGDNSDVSNLVAQYMLTGMSEKEARQQAFLDCVGRVSWAAAGGALSGAAMGGPVAGFNYMGVQSAVQQNGGLFNELGPEAVDAVIQEGLESDPSTKSYQLAEKLRQKLDRGGTATDAEVGRLYQANMEAIEAENAQGQDAALPTQEQRTQEQETALAQADEKAGLVPISEQMQASLSTGKNNIIARTFNDIVAFVKSALGKKGGPERLYMGTIPDTSAAFIRESTGVDVTGYTAILPGSSVQHIFNHHGNAQTENPRGQRAVSAEDVALLPQVLAEPDSVTLAQGTDADGRRVLLFSKQIGDTYITAQAVTDGRHALTTDSLWIQKKKDPLVTTPNTAGTSSPGENVRNALPSGLSSDTTIAQPGQNVNPQAATEGQETTEGTVYNSGRTGEVISDGGQGRLSGTGTGEQTGGVAERAGRRAKTIEQLRTAGERRNRAAALKQEKVSAQQLGIREGTGAADLTVMPEEAWDSEMQAAAERIWGEGSLRVTFVVGSIEVTGRDGAPRRVRGVFHEGGIVVQADHNTVTIDQIANHELFHDKAYRTPGMVAAIEARIIQRYGQEELTQVVNKYMEHMQGLVGFSENMDEEAYNAGIQYILEEIFADAYADINAFGVDAPRFAPEVNQVLQERGEARAAQSETSAATSRTTGPPETRYSIEYDENNTPFVQVDKDILEGVPRSQWVKTVKDNLRQKFPNGITVGNNTIAINQKSRGEMTFSRYMQQLMRENLEIYASKLRATNNADEILQASRNWINEALLHPRQDTIIDFARGTVQLRIGDSDYSAEVIVGNRGNGDLLLYDIINLAPTTIQERNKEADTAYTAKPPEGPDSRQTVPAYSDSVAQESQEVKAPDGYETRDQAELWEGLGVDTEYIREKTGWARDKDGEWRYQDRQDTPPARFSVDGENTAGQQDAASRTTGPPETRYSIEYDENNTPFVQVDKDILEGVPRDQWVKTVKDNLRQKFPNGITVGNNTIKIDSQSRGEMTYSQYTQKLMKTSPQLYADKLRATNNADEILQASRDWVNESLHHPRKDSIQDFARGTINLRIGESDYSASVVVAMRSNGDMVLYDLLNIQPIEIQSKGRMQQAAHPANAEADRWTASDKDSITPKRQEVKTPDGYETRDQAELWEGLGVDAEYIREKTGWARDKDGEWRYQDGRDAPPTRFSVDDEAAGLEGTQEDANGQEGAQEDTAGQQDAIRRLAESLLGANPTRSNAIALEEAGIDAETIQQLTGWAKDEKGDWKRAKQPKQDQKQAKPPKTQKPVAKSKPINAKQDLRQQLLNLFSIPEGQRAALGKTIDRFADQLLSRGQLTEEDRREFFSRLYDSGLVELPADVFYQEARRAIQGGRVYVTESERAEFGDDWNAFRKRAFAAGVLLTGEQADAGIDVWNTELSGLFPGAFDGENVDSRSVLETIVTLAEEGKGEKVSLDEYLARTAGEEYISVDEYLDNMERQMDWALRTFAEKAKLEVKLRDRTGVKLAQERDQRRQTLQRQQENRKLKELQQRTLKHLQWLSKNRNKAPADLRAAWDEVLGDIDVYAVSAANELNWSDKYHATWKDLARMYKDAEKNDPNFVRSAELERIVARLDAEKIGDMDISALQDLYKAAVGIRTEFYNRNNVINDKMHRMFAEVFTDVKQEMESAPGGYTGRGQFVNQEQLTPMNMLERMGGWNPNGTFYSMAQQLEEGERKTKDYTVRAKRVLETFLQEHAGWVKTADGQGKDAIWYEVEVPELLELHMGDKPIFGDTVTVYMTPAQKVQLYLESKNEQNLRHMMGGRTFVNKELYSQGKRTEALAQGTTIRLAPETVKNLVSDLTAEELALADALAQYYNGFAWERINQVSQVLYGYDKAVSQNYVPIFTDQNFTKSEIGVFDVTAEGVGHMKGRIPYASNPSYNLDAFSAFDRHVDQTSRFVGMSIPARNWNTLLNWRQDNSSTSKVISSKWGSEGLSYVKNLIEDLQGNKQGQEHNKLERAVDTVLNKYISSVFGFNPSIVFKQAMSFPLAGTYLGFENTPNIAKALAVDSNLINTYTSELAYRLMGYSTPETATLKDNPSKLSQNKALNFLFNGGAITAMDGWTVKTIWSWAENSVRRANPELEVGTQEQIDAGQSPFYQKVAAEFEEAVSRSQPMYDVMHRSNIMRNGGAITRALTLFKTVPQQQYNMLRQTYGEAQYYKQAYKEGHADQETYREAQKRFGRATLGVILAGLGIEAISFLNALLKNAAKSYRDDDGELTWESAGLQFLKGFASDNLGMMIGGDLAVDAFSSLFLGDSWYGIETPGVTQIEDIFEEAQAAFDTIGKLVQDGYSILSNGGDVLEYLRRNGRDYLGALDEALEAVATYMGGIPANNIKSYALGALSWISPEMKTALEDALKTADKSGLKGLSGEALEMRVEDILSNRLGSTEEETAAVLAGLYEAGYPSAVPTDTPDSISVDGETLKLDAYQQQFYDTVWRDAVGQALDELAISPTFQGAEAEVQAKMLAKLYDYGAEKAKAALSDEYSPDAWVGEADESVRNGDTLAEWIAWKALSSGMSGNFEKLTEAGLSRENAMEVAQELARLEPEGDSTSVSSAQKYVAIAEMPLSESDKAFALEALMSESAYAKYQAAREAGISTAEYCWFLEDAAKLTSDKDANGNTISGSKKDKVLDLIDSLDLTGEQKNALYFAQGYTESTLWSTPWHGR